MPPLFASMRLGLGLGLGNFRATSTITESVWTIAADADGTKYVRIRCATTGQTLTAAGGAEIKLGSDGEWGTSVVVPSGDVSRYIYYRGNGTGGTLTFPNPENITYLYLNGTGTSITGIITGMKLTTLYLSGTGTSITGSITGMPLTYLTLAATGTSITGTITGMELTYLYLYETRKYITGSITGMKLTFLYLYKTGTSITGVPPAIGKTLSSIRILNGDSYDYPWTSQTWDATTKRTWTAGTMSIDCLSTVGAVEFNTWLLGLASVSNPGTAKLTLKNTPTIDELNDAGYGETDTDSGYYAMVTTLGYTLTLGSQ